MTTSKTAAELQAIPIPPNMDRLPRNDAGYVIPWFVGDVDGKPDFRVVRPRGISDAVRFGTCWLCGLRLGGWVAFVVGPMCAVNRVSAEPPSHVDCAEYAAQACPFLADPKRRRRGSQMPDHEAPAGVMIPRNPGVALVWVTKASRWSAFRADPGVLFDIGEPERTSWWAHSRAATREEVQESIRTGLPILEATAAEDGPMALKLLTEQVRDAEKLIPA